MSEQSLETCQDVLSSKIPLYRPTKLTTLRRLELHSDLAQHLRKRNLRHQGQLKNDATKRCLSLYFKYNARSLSELYDQCTPDEWANLIYAADTNIHKHLNIAQEMYIKECLYLQRANRWSWFIKYADYIPDQVNELEKLFKAQNIDIPTFCNDVFHLLNLTDPKKNCLLLYGHANSGKSLIGQLLVQGFISSYVNNHNSENEFYLSSFLNKAICICEELMITPATAEDFKSILGGANIDISKKYTAKQVLTRTPIIVTSNHKNFGRGHLNPLDEIALRLRCYSYYFSTPYRPSVTITLPALSFFISDNVTYDF